MMACFSKKYIFSVHSKNDTRGTKQDSLLPDAKLKIVFQMFTVLRS